MAAGVAFVPVSVSAGSRAISTQPSGPDCVDSDSLASQPGSAAAALAAPASMFEASGTEEAST